VHRRRRVLQGMAFHMAWLAIYNLAFHMAWHGIPHGRACIPQSGIPHGIACMAWLAHCPQAHSRREWRRQRCRSQSDVLCKRYRHEYMHTMALLISHTRDYAARMTSLRSIECRSDHLAERKFSAVHLISFWRRDARGVLDSACPAPTIVPVPSSSSVPISTLFYHYPRHCS
jgi:hypothetical protein